MTVKTSNYLITVVNNLSRMNGHPWNMKKVAITGAGRIWDCKNTEFCMRVE